MSKKVKGKEKNNANESSSSKKKKYFGFHFGKYVLSMRLPRLSAILFHIWTDVRHSGWSWTLGSNWLVAAIPDSLLHNNVPIWVAKCFQQTGSKVSKVYNSWSLRSALMWHGNRVNSGLHSRHDNNGYIPSYSRDQHRPDQNNILFF